MLKEGGRLGYITMNTLNGAVRYFICNRYNRYAISIGDFRGYQVFKSKIHIPAYYYLDKQHGAEVLN